MRSAARVGLATIAFVGVGHLVARWVHGAGGVDDVGATWPISEAYGVSIDLARIAVFAVALAVGGLYVERLCRGRAMWPLVGLGVAVVLLSNAVQGLTFGFAWPISGGGIEGIQYYHDGIRMLDVGSALRQWTALQHEGFGVHTATHPPGAVLLIRALGRVLPHVTWVSALVGVVSVGGGMALVYGILRSVGTGDPAYRVDPGAARAVAGMYPLLPAVQVYGVASIDALIALLVLLLVHEILRGRVGTAAVAFVATGALTYAALFLAPAFAYAEWRLHRRLRASVVAAALLGLAWFGARSVWGFDYWAAFGTAVRLENPGGFLALADPARYVMTRWENVAELLLFGGPILWGVTWIGARSASPAARATRDALVACVVIVGLAFVAGAYRTGETARTCLFVYGLTLPLLAWSPFTDPRSRWRPVLACALLGQGLAMQLVGFYFW